MECAVAEAVNEYNEGLTKIILKSMEANSISVGFHTQRIAINRDKERMQRYEERDTEKYRNARKLVREATL